MKYTRNCLLLTVCLTFFSVFLTGCDENSAKLKPDKLVVMTSETVLGKPNAELKRSIKVELLSKPEKGMLGGEGEPHPISNAKIIAKVGKKSQLKVFPPEGLTDLGGCVEFDVTLGSIFCDEFVEVALADDPSIKKKIRFVTGVTLENAKQEVQSGEAAKEPIRIKLLASDGVPVTNETVYFTLARQPGKKGKLSKSEVKTDVEGVALVSLQTDAKATGKYEVRMEVANPESGFVLRPIFAEVMALNIMGIIIGVFGGLAIFIFGMTLMSDGLQQVAGNKMKATLDYITRNRFKAIMAGTVVTALVQSSSATTVMTVGFVNAGLLSLQQAIGVIFGANIGTTVTGQLVSFKLDNLALPAVIMGVVGLLVFRKVTWQGTARAILGFGLLFFGMTMMSNELKTISAFPSFVSFFQIFDCSPLQGATSMPWAMFSVQSQSEQSRRWLFRVVRQRLVSRLRWRTVA
jgi:phosphate:Na+ symporter